MITDKDMEDLREVDLFDECLRCGADLSKVKTCGICRKNVRRVRQFPEHHKYNVWLTLTREE